MITAGVRSAKMCADCESCDGIVCNAEAGVTVARYYPINKISIVCNRTETGCVVRVKMEAEKK